MARSKREPTSPPALRASPRDPLARITRMAQILAIGLIGAACFLTHPNSLNRTNPKGVRITLDAFPDLLEKAAVAAVHTRATWVVLAVIAASIAMSATRTNPRQRTLIRNWGTLALFLVIALHSGAQAYLQSKSPLRVKVEGIAPGDTVASINRLTLQEGTAEQWQLLFAGDALFCAPVLLVWLLYLLRPKSQA
jgi:hypothetical protein